MNVFDLENHIARFSFELFAHLLSFLPANPALKRDRPQAAGPLAERLHAIRFLGNDAAHEIKKADAKNLLIALRIIEHLLVNIYILDGEADKRLDTIIRTFEQFTKLLEKNLASCTSGEEVPLAKIFGKDMRRFHGYFTTHEQALIDAITNGTFTKLQVGKVDHFAGSKDKVQHFVVP